MRCHFGLCCRTGWNRHTRNSTLYYMVHSCLRIELCAKGECNPLAQSEMMNTSHLWITTACLVWEISFVDYIDVESKQITTNGVIILLEYSCQFLHDIKIPKVASKARAHGVLIYPRVTSFDVIKQSTDICAHRITFSSRKFIILNNPSWFHTFWEVREHLFCLKDRCQRVYVYFVLYKNDQRLSAGHN